MSTISKQNICKNILMVDGYSASGKGLLCHFLETFNKVSKMQVSHLYNQIAILDYLKFISRPASLDFLNMQIDMSFHSDLLGRDTNYRFVDDSSVFKSRKFLKYFFRSISHSKKNIHKIIEEENPTFLIMNHFTSAHTEFYFEALGPRLKYINIEKHPVYLFPHWTKIFQKILDNDPLMYQFILNLNGKKHMWFDTENAFNDNVYDFIIQSMVRLDKISKKKRITENDTNNYLNICFEKFVTNIFHYNEKIERFLNLNSTTSTKRFIKKNKLNKKYLHDRKWKHTYFGWKLEENLETKKKYFDKLNFIKKKCSKDNFQNLIELCKNYENKFGLKFPNTNNF